MKKFKKLIIIPLIIMICLTTLFGCGESYIGTDMSSSAPAYKKSGFSNNVSLSDNTADSSTVITTDRLIVYTVDIKVTPENQKDFIKSVTEKTGTYGGYIQSSEESSYNINYVFKIPTEHMNEFISNIESNAEVNSKRIESTDVTDNYTNAQIKVESLRANLAALEALLDKATELSDSLAIQKEINSVSNEIMYYEKQATTYKKQSDYSTIDVTVYKKGEAPQEEGFFASLGRIFGESINAMLAAFKFIIQAIVAITPFAVLAGIILLIILFIKKRKSKKS